MTLALEIADLSAKYGQFRALDGVSLSVSAGETMALVGANGLGVPVVRALNQVNTALGFESGFVIVVVAIMLDRILNLGNRK